MTQHIPRLIIAEPLTAHVAAPLQLVRDVRRHYGTRAAGGSCRLRVFSAEGRTPIVLCSQDTASQNWCISAVVEFLAASAIGRFLPHRFDEPEPAIWLEHYPLDPARQKRGAGQIDVAQVLFADWRPVIGQLAGARQVHIGEPSWQQLSALDVASLLGPHARQLD